MLACYKWGVWRFRTGKYMCVGWPIGAVAIRGKTQWIKSKAILCCGEKGKGWVGQVETVGLSGAADRKARKRQKKLCPFTQTRLASTMDCVCSCLCVCVYIMFVIWQECSANQPVGKLALNMWQSGCWAMARLRERKREKRKTLGAWWARKRGKRKRQKWIKLNAMGIVLHDFCGFYRRGKKNEEKENFKRG